VKDDMELNRGLGPEWAGRTIEKKIADLNQRIMTIIS
jgi:hypothetical protein